MKDFLLNLFERANPDFSNGKMPTMRDAVDLGVKRLEAMPDSEADVRAEIEVELGVIYAQFGDMPKAQQLEENALRVLRVSAHDPVVAVRAARFEAVDYGALGDFNKAQALADEAYERVHKLRNPSASEVVKTLDVVHYVALHRSDLKRLKQLGDEALKAIDGVATTDETRGMAYAMAGDYARLTHDSPKAVDYYLRAWPLNLSAQTRSAYGLELGISLQDLGRYREARDYLEKTFAACAQAYGESSTRALRVGQMLAITEADLGDLNKAAAHFDHLRDLARQAQPVAQDVVAEIELNEAEMLMALERYDAASEHVKVAIDYGHSHTGRTRERAGGIAVDARLRGDVDRASRQRGETIRRGTRVGTGEKCPRHRNRARTSCVCEGSARRKRKRAVARARGERRHREIARRSIAGHRRNPLFLRSRSRNGGTGS